MNQSNKSANDLTFAKLNLKDKLEIVNVQAFKTNRNSKPNTKVNSSSKKYKSERSERSEDDYRRCQKLFFQYHCANSKNILANVSQPLLSVKTTDGAKDSSMYSLKRELEARGRVQ